MGTVVVDFGTRSMGFSTIIPRNHKIPAKETQTYSPVVDFQETLDVVVMEGDEKKPLDDPENVVIWRAEVRIPEPRPMAEISLEFTYEYDASGILYVTLKESLCRPQLAV